MYVCKYIHKYAVSLDKFFCKNVHPREFIFVKRVSASAHEESPFKGEWLQCSAYGALPGPANIVRLKEVSA